MLLRGRHRMDDGTPVACSPLCMVWPVMKGNPFFACCLMCFCATVQSASKKKKPSPPSLLLPQNPFTAAIHSVIQFSSGGTPSSLNYLLPLIILSPETGILLKWEEEKSLETVLRFGRNQKIAHSFPRFFFETHNCELLATRFIWKMLRVHPPVHHMRQNSQTREDARKRDAGNDLMTDRGWKGCMRWRKSACSTRQQHVFMNNIHVTEMSDASTWWPDMKEIGDFVWWIQEVIKAEPTVMMMIATPKKGDLLTEG